ncbi:MAG: hypothetical protein REJ23_08605 [Brevundimonas sp.]|nr:hypothetical protein [Brevundimonas sp.]
MWFWKLIARLLVRGKNDYEKSERLNGLLPKVRTQADQAAREAAKDKLEGLAKLAVVGSFSGMATLIGLAEVLEAGARPSLQQAGYCFAVAGISAVLALVLSIVEPTFKATLWGRHEWPDEPMYGEEEYLFDEAVESRLGAAHWCVRGAVCWRVVSGGKTVSLLVCMTAFCSALIVAVGAMN